MKRLFPMLLILLLLLTACTQAIETPPTAEEPPAPAQETEPVQETPAAEPVQVSIAGLKGPTSMGMVQLFANQSPTLDGYETQYAAYAAPDELTGKIITGEVQIAAVPTNLASVLFNKTQGKVQLLNVNTLGVIHVVGSGDATDLEGLKGETLYISGKGATPDYVVNYMLEQAGLADEVTLEFYPDHASLAQAVIAKDATYAVLPQPFVTQVMMASEEVDLLIDLNGVWESLAEIEMPMGCLVVNTEFAAANPEYISAFLEDYAASVTWVNANPTDAGVLIEEQGILPKAILAEKAIPNCAIVFETATEARENIDAFLEILYGFNPASVGGNLPDETFYYSH